jgi:hypothetical protein
MGQIWTIEFFRVEKLVHKAACVAKGDESFSHLT